MCSLDARETCPLALPNLTEGCGVLSAALSFFCVSVAELLGSSGNDGEFWFTPGFERVAGIVLYV